MIRKCVIFSKKFYSDFSRKVHSQFGIRDMSKLQTKKLSEDDMNKVIRPGVTELAKLFSKYGYELRIAGGPVRDILLGITPEDLDFATTATPDQMKKFFNEENIRLINTGGEKHGTITPRISETNFECTALRIDKTTDGRHAEVEFVTDWEVDAGRRDLTVNAMFLGLHGSAYGTVYDYFNGIEHVEQRYITFVGDAGERIREDYLRILRYFRFFGRLTENNIHDQTVIDSISENVDGLARISAERKWVELKKILLGKYADTVLEKMKECNVFPYLGLPDFYNIDKFSHVFKTCIKNNIMPSSVLVAGFDNEADVLLFAKYVKCSNKERDSMVFIFNNRHRIKDFTDEFIRNLYVDMKYGDRIADSLIKLYLNELFAYCGHEFEFDKVENLPIFPVNGHDIKDFATKNNFTIKNKQIKFYLSFLLKEWKNSNFILSKDELLKLMKKTE